MDYLLSIPYCLLPIAYYLLPIAYYLLPIAYCLFAFAYAQAHAMGWGRPCAGAAGPPYGMCMGIGKCK